MPFETSVFRPTPVPMLANIRFWQMMLRLGERRVEYPAMRSAHAVRRTRRVAVYLRLSIADLREGESVSDGITRQREDTLVVAHRRGVPADARIALHTDADAGSADVVVYVEDGESAWQKKKVWITDQYGERRQAWRVVRPVWGQLMRDVRAGMFMLVVVYNSDRLVRDLYDTEDVIETAQHFGQDWDAASGTLDLSSDDGRTMARIMATMSQRASADTSRRVRRAHRAKAERGEPMGGVRPFGWQADRRTVHPGEAAELRAAVEKIRTGTPPGVVIKDWTDRGILTTRGNPWRWTPFIMLLRNPRLCGYRGRSVTEQRENGASAQRWEIVQLADGTEVKGLWTPIITRDEWDDLITRIGSHVGADRYYVGAGVARYLLSGMVFCGKCGSKMAGNRSGGSGPAPCYVYQCVGVRDGGCGNNTRNMPKVDALIEALALRMHAADAGEQVEVAADPEGHAAELERIERLLHDAYTAWKGELLPSAEYFVMRRDLENDRTKVLTAQASIARVTATTDTEEIVSRWQDATVQEKRLFVRAYVSAVVIHPIVDVWDGKRGRMVHPWRFNPALIEPVPVTQRRPTLAS
jgi:DNA invertase Pin-like site-specific DNA recombinase